LTEHVCEDCGKSYKTRSGLWKHQKAKGHGKFAYSPKIGEEEGYSHTPDDSSQTSMGGDSKSAGWDESPKTSTMDLPPSDPPADTFSWSDFDFGTGEEATETIPAPLKSIVNQPARAGEGKISKAERLALEKQNKGILKMMLTWIDFGLTRYGRAVSLDEDFEVKHSESDKDLVANAQYRYLEEKGLFLTNYLSTGMIAGSLTIWYVGQPMIRIRKNAKKKLIRGRLLGRLPLIGRFFRGKQEAAPDRDWETAIIPVER